MTYIIDTHIFLWLTFSPERIATEKLIVLKDPQHKIVITPISFWEISLKYNLGKLVLQNTTPDKLPHLAREMNISIEPIDAECMASFHNLPVNRSHKDPFDRLLIAQAITEDMSLISSDPVFHHYSVKIV